MNPETERLFEELVLERGLVTPDQMAEARREQARSESAARRPKPLLDLLLERAYGDRAKLRDLAHLAALRSGAERVTIGGFELLEKLGEGGMGAVYRARQLSMGRFVAIKLMRPKLAREQRYLDRFLREAHASARLSHPNIVQGIDAGQDKGYYYFAMAFVDGETLRRIIAREGRLDEKRCIELGVQVARALDAACGAGLVHRDVKPENILIEHDTGLAKLTDLGLVKSVEATDTSVTQTGVALGTPNYISPEQARGDADIDIRTDIYSLGATLYHAATGALPFEGGSAPIIMGKHLSEPLEPPERRNPALSLRFSRVIQKMMAKKPDDRYDSPTDLLADLERIARGEPPLEVVQRARRRRRARRSSRAAPAGLPKGAVIGLSLAGVAILLLLLGLGLVLQSRSTDKQNDVRATLAYQKALELVVKEPTNFTPIIDHLSRCLELDPGGPNAKSAQALLDTARAFEPLTAKTPATPADWTAAAAKLKALAACSPDSAPYRDGILRYLRTTSLKLLQTAYRDAVADPARVPRSAAWLDAVARSATDTAIADEASAKKAELGKILHDNAEYILDRFARPAEAEAKAGRYKAALDLLPSCVPNDLVTPALRQLLDKKLEVLRKGAAQHLDVLRKYVCSSLDHDSLDMARSYVAQARKDLDLPELRTPIDELARTVDAAPKFLPLLGEIEKLESAAPRDERAIVEAALRVQKDFGTDPYVAQRLKKHEAAVRRFLAEKDLADRLRTAQDLIAQKKFAEAEDIIARVLADPAAPDALRRKALELRTQFGTRFALVRILVDAMKPRLPLDSVALPLEAKPDPVVGRITAVSTDSLTVATSAGELTVPWAELAWKAFRDLAVGAAHLVRDDDPSGLYLTASLCAGKDDKETKRLLALAIAEAEKRTDDQLPGRAALLDSVRSMLSTIREAEARTALKRLDELIKSADSPITLDRALAAWADFQKLHADSDTAKTKADALKQLGTDLAEAVVRIRSGPISQYVWNGEWPRVVTALEQALAESERIAPLPAKARRTVDELLRFGRAYLAEEVIYRDVFSARPWRGSRVTALKKNENKLIADRAERYSRIFDIRVNPQPDVDQQRRYATQEMQGNKLEPVRDLDTRLARYNAVFDLWPRDRDPCAWTEIDAAREIRNTGYGGDMMAILMFDAFLKFRRGATRDMRGWAELERLHSFVRHASQIPLFRTCVIQQAKQLMVDYRNVGDFLARFCLLLGEQYEAAGDDDNALKAFDALIDPHAQAKQFAWHGHLGRGRIRERQERYPAALADYETALKSSSNWPDGMRCAAAIADLCIRSGKLPKPERAERAVEEVLSRTDNPQQQEATRRLLEKK